MIYLSRNRRWFNHRMGPEMTVMARPENAGFGNRFRKAVKKSVKESLGGIGNWLVRQSLIPDKPVFEKSDFPWAAVLEEKFPIIQRELAQVMTYRDALPRLHEVQREQYRVSADDKWKVFVVCGWGYISEEARRMCPETTKIVETVPGLRSALFSILGPGAKIPEHRGHVKGLLRGHLGMIVPEEREKCFLRVADEVCHWEEGKMLIFDDNYRHEVQNNTDQERVVLLLHFDRPMNRLGRFANECLMFFIRKSPFVKNAVRNERRWQDKFRREIANTGGGGK